jgi:O-antigen/teichoic acid export membrane protein
MAGIASERIDNLILRDWLPEGFYEHLNSTEAMGVYAQTVKLSVLMLLAIQAFRYAGEPFFFSQAENKNSPELFAKVMHYFVLLSLVIFIGVSVNIDLIAEIFLRNPAYRIALYLVPFLLFGKLLWGIYVNLSIWFKLTDKTIYGTYFSVFGAVITIVMNLVLIPIIGYDGSAIAMICGYSTMCLLCYIYGKKYFPIPYKFTPLLIHTSFAAVIVYISYHLTLEDYYLDNLLNITITLAYILIIWFLEKKKLKAESI